MKHEHFIRQIERLVIILEDWADWQRGYSGVRGYPKHSVMMQSGYASSKSFDDMLDESNASVCNLVDAAIDDLSAGHSAAIRKRYGIAAVFRFPRGNYETLLSEAHLILAETLPKKGVVI